MKKTFIICVLSGLLFFQCGNEADPFLITDNAIGNLTKEAQIYQVDSIFANDSIVKLSPLGDMLGTQGAVEIYEKGGKKLMLLSPENDTDSTAVITNIQLFDDRYMTEKGLNLGSTFGDVKANYEVVAVENAINSVVVFLKDSDVYITIDKKQLPESIRYNFSARVEATQIPDEATFKYFMIGWDPEEIVDEDDSEE